MEIEIRLFANYRDAAGGRTLDWEAADGATVGDVVRDLMESYPDVDVLTEAGEIRQYVNVLYNGRNVIHGDGLGTPVSDGDVLSLFPPVAGG